MEEQQRVEEEKLVEEKTRKRTESIASGMDKDNTQQSLQHNQEQQPPSSSERSSSAAHNGSEPTTDAAASSEEQDSTTRPSDSDDAKSAFQSINQAAAEVVDDLIRQVALELDGVDETLETLTPTDNSVAADGGVEGNHESAAAVNDDAEEVNWTTASTPVEAADKLPGLLEEGHGRRTPTGSVATQDTG